MASKRIRLKSFPAAMFAEQYSAGCKELVQARQVQVRALRSKKHATVEISLCNDEKENETQTRNIIIAKYFPDADKELLCQESMVYAHAASAGIPVPKILHVLDNFIVLERVNGTILMDLINDNNVPLEQKKDAILSLGAWLGSFHVAFATHPSVRRRGDANLRNFIMAATGTIIGLDFEEASLENPLNDLHEVFDSVLQSNPGIYTDPLMVIGWKFDLYECLLRGYAKAVRKPLNNIIGDPEGFIDAQLQVMLDLAAIRGSTRALLPLVPEIKNELAFRVSMQLTRRG
ncbi:MAG: hypothetical protein Q6353_011220 [Candidatus Sigynarchaeum springense]